MKRVLAMGVQTRLCGVRRRVPEGPLHTNILPQPELTGSGSS